MVSMTSQPLELGFFVFLKNHPKSVHLFLSQMPLYWLPTR